MSVDIFIGYDSREPIAYHVASHSLLRRSSVPLAIHPLVQSTLRAAGLYTRERNAMESTEFSFSRFLVPHLMNYRGLALFMDSDMLCLTDITDVSAEIAAQPGKAVYVCQHDYTPHGTTKMDGQVQTAYPRKNWSSFIVFDCARCKALTPEFVNTATGLELHRFQWLADHQIGSLPLEWNVLVGEANQSIQPPKVIHYTDGGPWFRDYARCPYATEWYAEHADMDSPPLIGQYNRSAWMVNHVAEPSPV